jgi:seryl-tRNA synthetase
VQELKRKNDEFVK